MSVEGPRVYGARWLMCSRCGCTHIDGKANDEKKGIWFTVDPCKCPRWFHKECAAGEAHGDYASGPDWIASYLTSEKHSCTAGAPYINFTRDRR